MTDVLQSMFS